MSTVHFRQQAGAASSAIAGDVTGTLPATTVAKVAGQTPTSPGLALLTAPTFAEALALLGSERSPVNAATTTTLPTYARVGNVLTGTANGALAAQDGVTLIAGQRLLVKDETGGNQPYNGIYTVTQVGVVAVSPYILTRSADCDTSAEITGAFTEVLAGTVNVGSQWVMTTANPTLGTTALSWQEYGGVSPFGPVGGDLSGTLPNPTVAKVAGSTPSANGVSLISAASYTAMLALLAANAAPGLNTTGKVGLPTIYIQQNDANESAGSLTPSADLIAPVVAGASYVVAGFLRATSAAVATGFQWGFVGPTNNVGEAQVVHTPTGTTSESQVNGALGAVSASTGSSVGPVPMGEFGWAFLTAHASAPSPATIGISFKSEVGTSQVTLNKGSIMLVWRTL